MLHEPISRVRIFDGAMGTELSHLPEAQGHMLEELNILHPEIIENLHRRYIEAGADYLTTNSFSISPTKWKNSPLGWQETADAAIAVARRAAQGTDVKVMFDMGPSGRMMEPIGDYTFEQAYDNVRAVVEHVRDRVDGFIIETFSDLYEMRAAVLAVRENTDLPLFATMTFDASGRTLTGSTPEIAAVTLTALGVDVLGINCSTSPKTFVDLVRRMRPLTHLPIMTQPNMGLPMMKDGKTFYNYTDDEFAHWTERLIEAGASIVGGCCGTSPATIAAIARFKGREVSQYPAPADTYICSATQLLQLQKGLICGERLNPTGKKKLKEALLARDFDYLQKEALNQESAGADFLDLNVGIANCDEKALLCQATRKVQEVCDLPLQLDSSSPDALEAAIRIYNGVPMINSINGSDESMDALLPVVAKYGTPTVALTLDKDGIPETAEGRIGIAQRIIDRAARHGIDRRQLVFDALVMTVSSNQSHGQTTLRTLEALKHLGVLTIVGLSNISFGLPERAHLNRTFLAMAFERGLDIPIMNPLDRDIVQTVRAFNALSGIDANCERYIAFNTAGNATEQADDLFHAVVAGLRDTVGRHIEHELQTATPESIISDVLIPALTEVGERFEKKTVFLPQLIQSAEAAKAAFEILSTRYARNDAGHKGTVVIATVKGDVHDIGKNIVKVVMQSHGYKVVDLGKNVDKETVAEACRRHNPMAVGLSALMTTTVDAMEDTIRHLRSLGIGLPVMVGGAVLTEEIAAHIGADYYAQDALTSVGILEKIRQ